MNGESQIKADLRYQKRKDAIDAVARGETPTEVAQVLDIPIRTMFEWLARYRQGGYDALRDGARSGRPRKVTAKVMRWLYEAITSGDPQQYQFPFCLWTLAIIRTLLKREHGIELSKSGVSRLLRHLGLSPQRPIYRSYKQDPKQLEKYLNRTFPELQKLAKRAGAVIYFIDEASVRSDAHRGTTWGKIGETPVVLDSGDRFGLKLISAVSPRGDMKFATFEGRRHETGIEGEAGLVGFCFRRCCADGASCRLKDFRHQSPITLERRAVDAGCAFGAAAGAVSRSRSQSKKQNGKF